MNFMNFSKMKTETDKTLMIKLTIEEITKSAVNTDGKDFSIDGDYDNKLLLAKGLSEKQDFEKQDFRYREGKITTKSIEFPLDSISLLRINLLPTNPIQMAGRMYPSRKGYKLFRGLYDMRLRELGKNVTIETFDKLVEEHFKKVEKKCRTKSKRLETLAKFYKEFEV